MTDFENDFEPRSESDERSAKLAMLTGAMIALAIIATWLATYLN